MYLIHVLMIAVAFTFLFANDPMPYDSLAKPLQKSARKISQLNEKILNVADAQLVERFCHDVENVLQRGEMLAKTANKNSQQLELYLNDLRSLSRQQESIYQLYRRSLLQSIESGNKKQFEHLASLSLEPLHHPRIRSEAIAFYQKNFTDSPIKTLEALCDEQELEKKSIQMAIEQEQAYEEHLRILKRSEAQLIKKNTKIGSRNSVIITADMNTNGALEFEAENLNPYRVTLSLDFQSISNLSSSSRLPLTIELIGKSKKKILVLNRIDSTKPIDYRSSYGWVRGSAFAQHNDSYLYALPFAKGNNVYVSQGYHGDTSHKGLSAYAIDFPFPIGTPIYAAREGVVVGSEDSNTLGGASAEYRQYANYVIIEHDDGTMGNYFHLKQGGSTVHVGDKVSKGQLIAYSGNTGYSSGPHLHFSVSKVDPISMRRPMNLPIKLQTMQGIVTYPRHGDQYTVQ